MPVHGYAKMVTASRRTPFASAVASMTIPPAIDRFGMRREPPPGDLCRYKTRQRPSVTGRWPHCMKGDIATLRDSETYRPRYSLVSCGQA